MSRPLSAVFPAAWRCYGVVLALCCSLAACNTARPQYADPSLLFQDDFAQPTSGWNANTSAEATTNYDNGQYLIAVEQVGVDVWAQPGLEFSDTVLEVDTRYAAGPVNNEFGLICRYTRQSDKSSFYFFLISSDGYYAQGKVVDNKRTILNPATGDFQPASAILQDPTAVNRLSATCQGSHFAFTVNGTPLGEFADEELTRGDIGLMAGTYDEPGVQIHFDNLVVKKP